MPAKPLDIGELTFAKKGDAAEHFRQILYRQGTQYRAHCDSGGIPEAIVG